MKRLAHWLFAWVLASEGDFLRALREADTAVALRPYDGIMHIQLSQLLITAGEVKKGMEWNELAHPEDAGGLKFQNYNRGLGLRLLGKYEDSIAAFKQSYYPDGDTPLHVAIALVRLGRLDEAKAEVKACVKEQSEIHRGQIQRNATSTAILRSQTAKSPISPRPACRRSDAAADWDELIVDDAPETDTAMESDLGKDEMRAGLPVLAFADACAFDSWLEFSRPARAWSVAEAREKGRA